MHRRPRVSLQGGGCSGRGHFPGCWVGCASPSLPAARCHCQGNLALRRRRETVFNLGFPGGAAPWRGGDIRHPATALPERGRARGRPADTLGVSPGRTLHAPVLSILPRDVPGPCWLPEGCSGGRGQRRAPAGAAQPGEAPRKQRGDFSHPSPISPRAVPAGSTLQQRKMQPVQSCMGCRRGSPPSPPHVPPVFWGSCVPWELPGDSHGPSGGQDTGRMGPQRSLALQGSPKPSAHPL